ncbi:ribose 5-phosphate isomerase [Liquorilactobacillus aquaticus DSM 21051]|uniref:ribose-5-phosphate isomerase n=1 Tax=Liquorilactobacillus aquaticus DSM 21051 TaxID=1423725 RepID=A0A0R2CXN0_9LACO|nr:ribose-5-phosphate isomerase A [Liquorilactobacillus aquaticus]KRM96010.1 ribose 5-phosphate isomerase [Liquorilactobacillus aquaticus DSM 21051]
MSAITLLIDVALQMIKPNMTVSLGGGSNVNKLAKAIAENIQFPIKICTPSEITKASCQKLGFKIWEFDQLEHLDLAFDGCDSIDYGLHALKSNGGIHVYEKLFAQAAAKYIILTPYSRIKPELDSKIPLTLEVLDSAVSSVDHFVHMLGGTSQIREAAGYAGAVRTRDGNPLVDCYFGGWGNIKEIDLMLSRFNGVVGTSYFDKIVTNVLTINGNNKVENLEREI